MVIHFIRNGLGGSRPYPIGSKAGQSIQRASDTNGDMLWADDIRIRPDFGDMLTWYLRRNTLFKD